MTLGTRHKTALKLMLLSLLLSGCHIIPSKTPGLQTADTQISTPREQRQGKQGQAVPNPKTDTANKGLSTDAFAHTPENQCQADCNPKPPATVLTTTSTHNSDWIENPQKTMATLENQVTQSLKDGRPSHAQAAILSAQRTVRKILSAPHPHSASNPQTTNAASLVNLTESLDALAQQIKGYHEQTEDAFKDDAKIHRARWLYTELQRLQLKANQGGFQPLVKFQLGLRQRQAQNLLSESLTLAIDHLEDEDQTILMKQLKRIAILSGEPIEHSSRLTHNLLQQAFTPVLNDTEIQSAMSRLINHFNASQKPPIFSNTLQNANTTGHFGRNAHPQDALQAATNTKTTVPRPQATKQRPAKPKWVSIAKKLDKAVRAGDLPGIQQLVKALKAQPELPIEQRLRAEAMESFLEHQIESLNAQADALYQQGHIQDAKTLWQMLLSLKPNDAQLTAKIARAETVLENLAALREQRQPMSPTPSEPSPN